MDISKEYIKMCENADEIQELWEPTTGDEYTTNVSIAVEEYNVYLLVGLMDKGFIWLPHQDQLQDVIDSGSILFWDLCSEPEGWLVLGRDVGEERIYPPDSLNGIYEHHYSDTAEQALLKAVMWSLYKKTWNGEDWIL